MSDFARPGGAALDPGGPRPWVPLPPAARRVAGRVAAAGAPLKEWGININYGISFCFFMANNFIANMHKACWWIGKVFVSK